MTKLELGFRSPKSKAKRKHYNDGYEAGIISARKYGLTLCGAFLSSFKPRNEFDDGFKHGVETYASGHDGIEPAQLLVRDK